MSWLTSPPLPSPASLQSVVEHCLFVEGEGDEQAVEWVQHFLYQCSVLAGWSVHNQWWSLQTHLHRNIEGLETSLS